MTVYSKYSLNQKYKKEEAEEKTNPGNELSILRDQKVTCAVAICSAEKQSNL